MANGLSIHIGLNRVDPAHYKDERGRPWSGDLKACEADARAMAALARARGYTTSLLLTEAATSQAVIQALTDSAAQLQSGDCLFLTYAGHGGQVPDRNSEFVDEPDALDETWCLYDRQLVDDELYELWSRFKAGVRILVVSDSCHSGTVVKDPNLPKVAGDQDIRLRLLPPEVQAGTYRAHRPDYDKVQASIPSADTRDVAATVFLLSGCQDNQFSADGDENGLFTATLLKVWNSGKYRGNIGRFHRRIVTQMPLFQTPNLLKIGAANRQFERQQPFDI